MYKSKDSNVFERSGFFLKRKLLTSAIASSVVLLGINSTFAQQGSGGIRLEEIVVTAQKRAESIQDIPIAVSAFSQNDLQERGLLGGGDLAQSIPNLSFVGDTGFGAVNFQIRGIGAQIEGISADVGVGVHINSVPMTVNRLAQAEFYDMERVEVLRGPQGTLYGRNATGGVVNQITAKPDSEFSAKLSGEYGNYDTKRVSGHVNIPVSDTFAIRAAGISIDQDGTVDNVETGNDINSTDIWSARFTAAWDPTDAFSAKLMYEHFEQDDTQGGNRKNICAPDPGPESFGGIDTSGLNVVRAALSNSCLRTNVQDPANNGGIFSISSLASALLLPPGAPLPTTIDQLNIYNGKEFSTDLRKVSAANDPFNIAENDLVTIDLQYDISEELMLTSITSYSKDEFLNRFTFITGVPDIRLPFDIADPQIGTLNYAYSEAGVDSETEQYTQEIRIQSDYEGDFNFNLGGIYLELEREQSVNVFLNAATAIARASASWPGPPITPPPIGVDENFIPDGSGHNYLDSVSVYELTAAALFGEAYYQVSDKLKATLGLRYTRDEKEMTGLPSQFLQPGLGVVSGKKQSVTFNELTGRVTIDYLLDDDNLLYASLSRGYKGGGINPITTLAGGDVLSNFEPEFVNALEFGSKSTIADGRGTLNLTGFYYDYQGYQVSRISNATVLNENVDATIFGLEVESVFQVTEGFKVNAVLGYTDSSIGDVQSIDTNDVTQGDPNYTAVNNLFAGTVCAVPTEVVAGTIAGIDAGAIPQDAIATLCGVTAPDGTVVFAPALGAIPAVPADLEGNELPYTPNYTFALGMEYRMDIASDWEALFRADYSYRGSAYSRSFNSVIDEVDAVENLNFTVVFSSPESGIDVQLYVRNLLSQNTVTFNNYTGEVLGNFRIVSGKDPEMYGIRVSKSW